MTGTNVHPGYLEAARDLMKDHLLGTGRFMVITVAGEPGTMETSAEVAVAKGREAGAALAVVVHLTRLAGTGRLRLIAYDVGSGNYSHADSIAIAGGPDDLDPALKRLAVGLATGQPASQTADIESVTQKQADPLLKESATKIFGLRLGAIVAFNRPAGSGDGGAARAGHVLDVRRPQRSWARWGWTCTPPIRATASRSASAATTRSAGAT